MCIDNQEDMFRKFIYFIKYNNLAVFVLLAVFLLGSGVFAQTETGQELIGERTQKVEGIDNILLLEADISQLDMNFKIEKIEADEDYYYVTYTFFDLIENKNVWQYEVIEKVRKISKKINKDLGVYLSDEFMQQYQDRVRFLKKEQEKANEDGPKQRTEVAEFDGLIGETLNLASKVFPDYEPVKRKIIPSPSVPALLTTIQNSTNLDDETKIYSADNLALVYDDYVRNNDPDGDNVFNIDDNCPYDYNPDQIDADSDGEGDECDSALYEKEGLEAPGNSLLASTSDENSVSSSTASSSVATDDEEIVASDSNLNDSAIGDDISLDSESLTVEIIELDNLNF